jgi:hypothetical protein
MRVEVSETAAFDRRVLGLSCVSRDDLHRPAGDAIRDRVDLAHNTAR